MDSPQLADLILYAMGAVLLPGHDACSLWL